MGPTSCTHSFKPSRIPLPKRQFSNLPAHKFSIWSSSGRKFVVPVVKDLLSCRILSNSPEENYLDWSHCTIEEPPLLESKTKLRLELETKDLAYRRYMHSRETKTHWSTEYGGDVGMFTLDDATTTPIQAVNYWTMRKFCNKPTALYWAHSAQIRDTCPLLPFYCIYVEWFRYHDCSPNIEFGHFFANPIRIVSTGPRTAAAIVQAHRSLCDRVQSLLDIVRRGDARKARLYCWPNPRNYNLLPLYRAIVIILDEFGPEPEEDHNGNIFFDKEIRQQNVLMVLTRDDNGLTAPINFDTIRSQSILRGGDVDSSNGSDTIRVPLQTAVRFIADLQRTEETASPNLKCNATDLSIGTPTDNISISTISTHDWVDEMIQKAEAEGYNNIDEAKHAIREVKAKEGEEVFLGPKRYKFPQGCPEHLVYLTTPSTL